MLNKDKSQFKKCYVYYGWTFLQILNMVNLRSNILVEGNAYLYIAEYEKIDSYHDVMNVIQDKRMFNAISVFEGKDAFEIIQQEVGRKRKINVIIPGFWCDALLFISELKKLFNLNDIYIIEEGIFVPRRDNLYSTISMVKCIWMGGIFYKSLLRHVNTVYTYGVKDSLSDSTLQYKHLPILDLSNPCREVLCSKVKSNEKKLMQYDVIYFDQNFNNIDEEKQKRFFNEIFKPLIKRRKKILVRLHPSETGRKRGHLFKECGAYLDDMKSTVEEWCICNIWDKKLVLTPHSSAAFNLRRMFGIKVSIIYLNRIFPEINLKIEQEPELNDGEYRPESMEEYRNILNVLNKSK